ncbi:MAG: fused MFS/spermidine synthase [Solirubrobacterales bacterium]
MTGRGAMARPAALGALVFVVGAASLGVEIAAARLLAPYFGASTIVWANTIGIVLVALSAGYWFGGRVADRNPDPARLGALVLVAAALIAVVPFAARPFLGFSVEAFEGLSLATFAGSRSRPRPAWPRGSPAARSTPTTTPRSSG